MKMPESRSNNKSLFFASQAGCLLPFLMVVNLLFGWMFFKPLAWVLAEGILILLFILSARIVVKKIFSFASVKRDDVIDVQGKVVGGSKKLE
jgi:hypothetical protein